MSKELDAHYILFWHVQNSISKNLLHDYRIQLTTMKKRPAYTLATYEKLYNYGDNTALFGIGYYDYIKGNFEKAFKCFKLASEKNFTEIGLCRIYLGLCYFLGQGTTVCYKKAIDMWSTSIWQNEGEAWVYLGYCYEFGRGGVQQSIISARKCYRYARDKNDPIGIGCCYELGIDVEISNFQAYLYYSNAFEKNSSIAPYFLGLLCDGNLSMISNGTFLPSITYFLTSYHRGWLDAEKKDFMES